MKKVLSALCIIFLLSGTAPALNGEIGTVDSVNASRKEITIKITSGKTVKMGDKLEISTPDGLITLSVKFPMMTIATCGIHGKGNISSVKPGMPVYPYGKTPQVNDSAESTSRFSDTGQGFVRDNSTGIMWLQDANYVRKNMSWEDAVNFVKTLEAAGYRDWRLPTKEEFEFFLKANPEEIKKYFDNVKFFYWTSTVYPLEPGLIWTADIDNRNTTHTFRTNDNYIWPVRDGKSRVRNTNTVKSSGEDDPVRTAAENTCRKHGSNFVSYSIKLDALTVAKYEINCIQGRKESKYNLEYDKFLGSWSD